MDRTERDVFQDRLVSKQIEGLEHHPDLGAESGERASLLGQRPSLKANGAAVDGLQAVDRPAQRGLAAARRADDDHHFTGRDGQVDVPQHVNGTQMLAHVLQADEGHRVFGLRHIDCAHVMARGHFSTRRRASVRLAAVAGMRAFLSWSEPLSFGYTVPGPPRIVGRPGRDQQADASASRKDTTSSGNIPATRRGIEPVDAHGLLINS